MAKENPTRYRAVWEFELRYPSDYQYVRQALETFTRNLSEGYKPINSDYLAIEKVETKQTTGG